MNTCTTPTPTQIPKLANGQTCSTGTQCSSTYCADGYCCNLACTGSACQTCGSFSSAGAGTCGYVTSGSQDPRNDCGTAGCLTGSCSGTGYACGYYNTGERSCAACQTCQGATSGSCVSIASNTQDTEGSNLCNSPCMKCSSGSCIPQSRGENLFGQCSGAYSCDGWQARGQNLCNGSGACDAIYGLGIDCYGTCANWCSNGYCTNDTVAGTCGLSNNSLVSPLGVNGTCVSGSCVPWANWVAVGSGSNTIAYSPDGINWTGEGTSIFSSSGQGVAWNGNMWVATGQGPNTIAYSYDGINWTGLGTSIFESSGWGVAWNGNMWVAVGNGSSNSITYSYDGIHWTGLGNSIFAGYGVASRPAPNLYPPR